MDNYKSQVNKFGSHSGHSNVPDVPARSVETAHVFKFETPNAGDTGDVDPASIWDEEPLEVVHSFIIETTHVLAGDFNRADERCPGVKLG